MPALPSLRVLVVLAAAGLSASLLSSCYSSACGSSLDVGLATDEPGDYVFQGLTRSWPIEAPFRCTFAVREDGSGGLLVTPGECEGRVGLYTTAGHDQEPGPADGLRAGFWGAPDEIEWTLSWTLPNALSEAPNQRSGTLEPSYEGDPECSHASETLE